MPHLSPRRVRVLQGRQRDRVFAPDAHGRRSGRRDPSEARSDGRSLSALNADDGRVACRRSRGRKRATFFLVASLFLLYYFKYVKTSTKKERVCSFPISLSLSLSRSVKRDQGAGDRAIARKARRSERSGRPTRWRRRRRKPRPCRAPRRIIRRRTPPSSTRRRL